MLARRGSPPGRVLSGVGHVCVLSVRSAVAADVARRSTSSWTRSALIAIAAAEPSPAAVITWARGSATLPAAQTPETLVRPVASTRDEAGLVELAAETVEQAVVRAGHCRADEDRGSRDRRGRRQARRRRGGRRRRRVARPLRGRPACRVPRVPRARRWSGRSVWAKKTTSSDHCRTSCACSTEPGTVPRTPSGWSRTSQPWQYGQWRRSRPHRSRTPGMSGSSSRAPVATRSRRAFKTRPPARRSVKPGSISTTWSSMSSTP